MGRKITMKKIILLSGSRAGSHYISTLFNTSQSAFHMPELFNIDHWPNKKDYIKTACAKNNLPLKYNKETIFKILENEKTFITKYYLGYSTITPKEIITFANNVGAEFYFLYRKNNIDSLISFLYMKFQGKPTAKRLEAASRYVKNNNRLLRETYICFNSYIKNTFTYEELLFTIEDLKHIEVSSITNNNYKITQKSVSPQQREKILNKDLSKYLDEREFYL